MVVRRGFPPDYRFDAVLSRRIRLSATTPNDGEVTVPLYDQCLVTTLVTLTWVDGQDGSGIIVLVGVSPTAEKRIAARLAVEQLQDASTAIASHCRIVEEFSNPTLRIGSKINESALGIRACPGPGDASHEKMSAGAQDRSVIEIPRSQSRHHPIERRD
jgi:hypothetical protein